MLRTKIEFLVQRKEFVTIVVTSAESGDGKTYFSINLAGIYSLTKKRTLLVDMDLRKPSIARELGITKEVGVSDVVIENCTLDEAIVHDAERGFDVLLAGSIPPNPSEIIASDRLKSIFEEVKARYEYIVIDTSPIGLVGDSYPLIKRSDITLLTAMCKKTNKSFLKNVVDDLKRDHFENVYMVLNGVDEGQHVYGYTSYYYTKSKNYYYVSGSDKKSGRRKRKV